MKDKRKKILFVIWGLGGGGAERVAINVLKFVNHNKFALALALFEKKGAYLEDLPPELKVYDLKKANCYDFPKLVIRLSRIIKRDKPDVVLSFGHYANLTLMFAKFFTLFKCRFCLSEHICTDISINELKFSKIRKILTKRLYKKADSIIAVSKGVKNSLIKDFLIPESKIKVIYNPFDLNSILRFSDEEVSHLWFEEDTPVIVACGRLTRQKNYPLLFEAFAKIEKDTKARLLILGEGEERVSLEKLTHKLGIQDKVAFLGFQKNPYKYMKKATVFVLSSLWEGFGNVLIEAMACGIPVISTKCPSGPDEIITNGVNGLLVPVGDVDALAEAILRLLKDEPLRRRLAEAGRKRAEDFGVEKIVAEYEKLFEEIK